jgi:hypothetical protein
LGGSYPSEIEQLSAEPTNKMFSTDFALCLATASTGGED